MLKPPTKTTGYFLQFLPLVALTSLLLSACGGSGDNTSSVSDQIAADDPSEQTGNPAPQPNPTTDTDGDSPPAPDNPLNEPQPEAPEQPSPPATQQAPLPDFIAIDYQFELTEQLAEMYSEGMLYLEVWSGSPDNAQQWTGDIVAGSDNTRWQITLSNLAIADSPVQIGVDARLDSGFDHRYISSNPGRSAYEGQLLARATSTLEVLPGQREYSANSTARELMTDYDDDNDGRSNLDETYGGTDSLNAGYDFRIALIRGSVPPLIDGDFTDSAWHPWRPTDAFVNHPTILAAEPLRIKSDYSSTSGEFGDLGLSSPEFFNRFQVSHDSTTLYIGILTDDRTPWFDSSDQWWHDDGIEIFIDPDNSRQRRYDGINDLAFAIGPTATDYSTSQLNLNSNSTTLPVGLRYAVGIVEETIGNRVNQLPFYEIAIPFSDLGLFEGAEFGLEIQINSDANGGDRDAKWNRSGPRGVDEAWRNPAYFSFVRIEP